MPQPVPPGFHLGSATPQDAIAAFVQRNLLQPSFRWQDVWQDEHTRAFAVAGISRLDVLKVFQDEVDLSLREGRSLADFRKRITPQLVAKGFWGDVEVTDPATGETRLARFDDARLRTVFDVNLRQSQAAGRWARIERTRDTLPLVMYRTMRDERVRASHRAWDGTVLPIDHPWWNTHYPPCGWRCRCRAFALSERDVERRRAAGETIKTEAPPDDPITYVNPRTGEVVPVPRGIDPGFAYNPGKSRDAALYDQLLRKALVSSPPAGAAVVAQAAIDHGAMVLQAAQQFGLWVDQVLAGTGAPAGLQLLGAVKPAAVRALQLHEIELANAAIAVRSQAVADALQHAGAAGGVPEAIYRRLPELIDRASALLRDTSTQALIYVVPMANGARLALQLDASVKLPRADTPINLVSAAAMTDRTALADSRYELLWGRL